MDRTQYKVSVRVADATRGGGDLPGLLDMMRYDGARVTSWEGPIADRFVVTLSSPRVTPDRWASFGLRIEVVR